PYIALGAATIFVGLVKLRRRGLYLPLVLLIFALGGVLNTYIHSIPNTDLDDFIGQAPVTHGQVLEQVKQRDSSASFILEARGIAHNNVQHGINCKIRMTVYFSSDNGEDLGIDIGDWIEVRGKIERPQGRRNPKGFDYRSYLGRRGIYYTMGVPRGNILSIKAGRLPWPNSWLRSARDYMARVFDTYVGGGESGLIKAMLIGEKWALPYRVTEEFRNTGIAHILAISGLHIGFIILLLSWLTGILKLSPKAAFFVQGIVLGVYCILVGGSPSVLRASIMGTIILGGRVIGRKAEPLNSLFLAAFIVLLINPLDLKEIGFQLSFGAAAGIILYSRPIGTRLGLLPKAIADSLAVMLSAQMGTWPLLAYYFNAFSPIGFVANLILVPIAGMIVILGPILLVVAALFPALAIFLGRGMWAISHALIGTNAWLSGFSWSAFRVVSPSIISLFIYYAILLIISQERPDFIKRPAITCAVLAFVALVPIVMGPVFDKDLRIVFVDVGQGDCIYIKSPDGKHILVDGGGISPEAGDFDVGTEIVVPFLLKNGIKRLDAVIMSHAHDDHIGGLIPVIEDLKVDAFMEYPPGEQSAQYQTLSDLVAKKGIRRIEARGGETYRIGKEMFLDIIYPVTDTKVLNRLYERNENNLSLVVRIRCQDIGILLTGDMEGGVESYLSKVWDESVSLLKVAHHGSKTSSTEGWIDIIDPDIAVIQSGKNNFGHPDPAVIQRFEDRGSQVFRNDREGAITLIYRKGKWLVTADNHYAN
ncbi:MAG TPA: DNA internalization-related competence protein ComEC/Rec2, partial [Clostridia bacterium]|nr:DNA internalization-related competence protein ComEC/Rec2 [Clostridia bacterium]